WRSAVSTEIATTEEITDDAPPPPPSTEEANGHKKVKAKGKDGPTDGKPDDEHPELSGPRSRHILTKPLKDIQVAEDAALGDWLKSLGGEGAEHRIQVYRRDPETARDEHTGQMIKVDGLIKSYNEFIDEDTIQRRHGGGKFEVKVLRKDPNGKY